MTTPFDPWTLFADVGLISLLMLIGKFLRVKVRLIQKLFIPPSLIAGLLGLAFGPNGLGWLPLSASISVYPAILIAVVFGALPLSSKGFKVGEVARRVGPMWAYSQLGMLLTWSVMGLFGIFVLSRLWPALHPAFGVMLPTGFYGGHGTAAAIGAAFSNSGWDEALRLGMTTATVGVILALIGGLFLIKGAARRGVTTHIKDFDELPEELRSGLIPKEKRTATGEATTSPMSVDSLTFHLAFVALAAFGGYLMSKGFKLLWPAVELPVFSCAFVVGLLMKLICNKTHISDYMDAQTTGAISSCATDYLVAFGVASIKLGIVVKYWLPLLILIIVGTLLTLVVVFFLGKHLLGRDWFEKSIFAWGWWTGTMAMGIALLRIVDPKRETGALDDYALAYLPCAPVEILLISLVPVAFVSGFGLWVMLGCLLLSLAILFLAWRLHWWK